MRSTRWATSIHFSYCALLIGCGRAQTEGGETCEPLLAAYDGPIELGKDCQANWVEEGPSGYAWCATVEDSLHPQRFPGGEASSIRWVEPPTRDSLSAAIEDGEHSTGALVAILTDSGTVDLSGYDRLVIDADMTEGAGVEVRIGHGETYCIYEVTGAGDTTYSIDLTAPWWCLPTRCRYGLQASYVSVGSAWFREIGTLDLTVKSLSFETTGTGAGTVNATQSEIGPGGYCWFVETWGPADEAEWVEPPSCGSAHANLTGAAQSGAVLAMELVDRPADLSGFRFFEFDAILDAVYVGVGFVTESRAPSGCNFPVYPTVEGRSTYQVDLLGLDCYGDEFDMTQAERVEFGTPWEAASTVDIEVFAARFVE